MTEIEKCRQLLENDGVIAFPTDTLYGIASLITSKKGFDKIYRVKGRETSKPVALCFSQISEILKWIPNSPKALLEALLPGPVTIVFSRKNSKIPKFINPEKQETIGIRIPDDDLTRDLCRDLPLCLTSANQSGARSAITPNDFPELSDHLDWTVDRGTIKKNNLSRSGSTIVELVSAAKFRIIRDGCALDETIKKLTELKYQRIF